jgi:hypothetical protein
MLGATIALILGLALGLAAQPGDFKDCKDHPLFPTRMPRTALRILPPFSGAGVY